jgi:exonuclease III
MFKKSLFRIDYLNIRGLKGKIQEVNKHLEEKSPDVFCLVETFLKTDNKPRDLHAKYR